MRALVETGVLAGEPGAYRLTRPLPDIAVPATVQAVLAARIDRLPPDAKRLLQTAAVIGTEVPFPLLQTVADMAPETLHRSLAQLQGAEFLYETHLFPERVHTFKHALTQNVAYQSLLTSTRQQVHRQIAQALETRFPETAETQPELLAHHYTEAALYEPAVAYWQRAGQRALARSAYLEAINHVTTGIELLKTLPETPERTQQALTLHIALGAALHDDERACSARGGARLRPGARLVSAGRRDTRACPSPVWAVAVLFWTVTVAHGARARGHVAAPGATCPRPCARCHCPLCPWGDVVAAWARCLLPASTWRKASHATRQTSTVRWCSALAKIQVLAADSMPRCPLVTGVPGASPSPPPRSPGVGARAVASL